jgi:hypothetical protein
MSTMSYIYNVNYQECISIIRDIVLIVGAGSLIRSLWNWRLDRVANLIKDDLSLREKIGPLISKYVKDFSLEKNDIPISFLHWKNYPGKFKDDGFKHFLYVPKLNGKRYDGWIDNVGVKFIYHAYVDARSLYTDKDDIFFFDDYGKKINEFEEHTKVIMVERLPFYNIINFDFNEDCGEPIFYTKHKYNSSKLYDDYIIIREVDSKGNPHKFIELSRAKMMKKYSPIKYRVMKLKIMYSNFVSANAHHS